MESMYNVIAMMTAGVSVTMGLLSLTSFFQKERNKLHLYFSILCLLVVCYILIPPAGFILSENVADSTNLKIKRIFNFSFMGFFPWFIALYTGNKKKLIPTIVSVSIVVCYLAMMLSQSGILVQFWSVLATIIMVTIIAHAVYASYSK